MATKLVVLDEVIAMLGVVGVPERHIERFRKQADFVISKKPRQEVDNITVSSGHGQKANRGFVELSINETLTQMEAAKAREVGLMLLEAAEAAEAAISDEIFLKLLERFGITDSEQRGSILLDLREIRQGTRGIAYPT